MDKKLEAELREYNLLPLSIDLEAQEQYRRMGIDPSTVETHYNPGTRNDIREKQEKIQENALMLHKMETNNQMNSAEYTGIVRQIREDLGYIKNLQTQGFQSGTKLFRGIELKDISQLTSGNLPNNPSEEVFTAHPKKSGYSMMGGFKVWNYK